MTGARRAAVLMVLLGEEVAGKLIRHLPEDEVAAIVREVAEIGSVDAGVAKKILEEYFVDALKPRGDEGGPEVAKSLLARSTLPAERRATILGGGTDRTAELLGPLLKAPPKALAEILSVEHPQTAALVLLQLPPTKAAQTLLRFDEAKRSETVLRMASLRQVRGELLDEVTTSLKEKLGGEAEMAEDAEEASELERTASILQNLKRVDARSLLESVERHAPERAAELRNMVFTFDTLRLADDRGVQELLRQTETKSLALALRGTDEELSEKFMHSLSERAAKMLTEEMEFLGTVRPEDQEAARREILELALQLEKDEKLVFEEVETGE